MNARRIVFHLLVILIALTGTAVAQPTNFRTHLKGRNQVPTPTATQAQGQAIFKLNEDGTEMYFKLIVANIENVWMAHIHLAPADANGPIVVWLFPDSPPVPTYSIPGRTQGVLAEGTFTAEDLVGPLSGNTLAELVGAIRTGNTYVNVHTNDFIDPSNSGPGDFPGGEIRGTIR